MATSTVKLYYKRGGGVDSGLPDSVIGVGSSYWLAMLYGTTASMYAEFDAMPSSLANKILYDFKFVFKFQGSHYDSSVQTSPTATGFNPATLTWNTRPTTLGYDAGAGIPAQVTANYTITSNSALTPIEKSLDASRYCKTKTAVLQGSNSTVYLDKLVDGTTKPYLEITYDTSQCIKSQVVAQSAPSGTSVDNRLAQTFSWDYVKNSLETYYAASDVFAQSSAKVYWRVQGTSTWHTINASGGTKSLSAPAYTFPGNSTIEWYVSGTDANGFTSTTGTSTFKTISASIAIISAPTGSNIDTRTAINFSWKLSNAGGDVAQASAKFYWRVSGAATYTQVSISGGTKSVRIPANTFPTGKTIQWYIQATAQGGEVCTSSTQTFTTVSTKVTLDTYPSGNSVYTAAGLRFTWHFASNVGNYGQAIAKLYWRSSTTAAYTPINASGSTQSLTVPANTFPTGKTIQWYIEGTDIGGLTSTTSVMSFTTVTTQITPQNSPTSGYADPRYAITFQWYFSSTGGPVPQGSATFYWRQTGASSWTSVAASGSTAKVTIPANTFPVATFIEWYLSGTDVGGTSSTSEVYTFSTTASTAYAYPQAPIGVAIDTSKAVELSWLLVNADGTLPIKVTLQWKRPTDVSWTTIRQASEAYTEWEVPADYFPIGEIEWRVIATNRDNVDGPAGTAAFVSVHAPDAPAGLTATPVPRTTISWQGDGQEGYEVIIDGETVHRAYGTETSWAPDFVLGDGTHVISVRIQGPYGLWSEPAITTIAVENVVPEGWEDLAVSGEFNVDAVLQATGADSLTAPTINWFRDGKRIAVTQGLRNYADRYVLGKHSYYIEIWNSDGNYARSNTVTGSMISCVTRIGLFDGDDWVDLRLSEKSNSEQNFTCARVSALRHVLGAVYPVLEISPFEDASGSYDCAFTTVEDAAKFESFRGRHVIVKSRGGNVVIGALLNLQKRYGEFYISYTFTIQAIDWEDFRYVSSND